jgi:myxalamid-type polyketide synthase MxaB
MDSGNSFSWQDFLEVEKDLSMSQNISDGDYRALLQQALLSVEQMQAKLRAVENAQHEPLAIIGMGFRFPGGANDAESFWKLLLDGTDAIQEVPSDRWNIEQYYDPDPSALGKIYSRYGGFLDHVDQFDPQFFGISPREAVTLDPQQRLLLEVTWEALENSGHAPSRLEGSRTGVFVGISGSSYANLKMTSGGNEDVDFYFATGIAQSVAAGRIAYTFGLHGPTVSIDTACSSSLVATHQACQSLRNHECDMALAGGVNLILEPSGSISTARGRMMSADGRCKTFDAAADGYVRSEGCGMIVLKRLSDAQADGDNILAVIMGSAVNQDGRSNGLTAPNGRAQETVIRAALENAKVKPDEISYVEAHGTGTSLGDPIEVRALGSVFGEGRSIENPLMVGSVKTNVGHLEAAAGIVGLVKVVLALQNKTIPPHLHLHQPNPYIPWNELPVTVPTTPTAWTPADSKRRIAGLSSFGFSGTNAHIIIAEAPSQTVPDTKAERTNHLFTLSAKSDSGLKELAEKYETYFEHNPNVSLADVAYTTHVGRSHFSHRLAIPASLLSELQRKLTAWKNGAETSGIYSDVIPDRGKPEVVFLFTGQGAQCVRMARQLYANQPMFRKMLEHCDEMLRPHLGKSLLAVIYPENQDEEDLIHQTVYTQPCLFAIEYCLAKLWQSWGVEPAVLMGHSIGEYVAACLAGVFSLEDALRLVAVRGRLMQSLPGGGVMAAVFATEGQVREAIAAYQTEVAIAAINGPSHIVISGRGTTVGLILATLQKNGVKSQTLNVSHAFHSPLIDPILDEFEQAANSIQYHAPQIGIVSNVTGKLITDHSIAKASYWREHTRQSVRFSEGIRTLHEAGYHVFLEVGPNPILLGMARRCEPTDVMDIWLPSLRSGRDDWSQMFESLAQLYVGGQNIDWENVERDYKERRQRLHLPTYAFQRQRYWMDFAEREKVSSSFQPENVSNHPLLGWRLPTALPVFQSQMNISAHPYLKDHRIHDVILLPATAYIEIALAAAQEALDGNQFTIENVAFHEALPLSENTDRTMQIVLTPDDDGASFQFFSRENESENSKWRMHASGQIRRRATDALPSPVSLQDLQARLSDPMPVAPYYQHLASVGADYGPAFRGLQQIWRRDGEALGKMVLPDSLTQDAGNYFMHPALLDSCIHLLGAAVPGADNLEKEENQIVYVPVGCESVQTFVAGKASVWGYSLLYPTEQPVQKTLTGDLTLFDEAGTVVAFMHGLKLQRVNRQTLQRAIQGNLDNWLYEVDWLEQPKGEPLSTWSGAGSWLIFADKSSVSSRLVSQLEAQGERCYLVSEGTEFSHQDTNRWQVDPLCAEDFTRLLADIKTEGEPSLRGIVHLWSLQDTINNETDLGTIHSMEARNCASVLHLVQALSKQTEFEPRLSLITRGAQSVKNGITSNPASTTLWGLGNVIALEQPSLNCTRIDLDPSAENYELLDELWRPDEEDQVAIRGSHRYLARLVQSRRVTDSKIENQPATLKITERGTLENLTIGLMKRRAPGDDEVEIEVHATGLNFRDVLNALGMYPGDPGPLGGECAGTITAVGKGVADFQAGDAVIALAADSFSSYVTVSAVQVFHKPTKLNFAEAATIPIAFLTADFALNYLSQMKRGERVLIHAAAGGVGMAAIQLAQRAGAEIFGTAGSVKKRKLLESLGVKHVMNSRTLEFSEQIMQITNGEGVDIVLNSLAGEFIPKSSSVLRESGRFVEIGKTGIWDQDQVRKLKPDVAYFILYLGEILEKNPSLIRERMLKLLTDFESEILGPLPQKIYPMERSVDAFRFMAQAKHIGKIIITQNARVTIRPNATYLITGGLGGLGLICAHWLVEQGARHLVLLGRNEPSPQIQESLDEIKALGAELHIAKTDVSRTDQLQEVLNHIAENMPPLSGIIHAAGVLDDGVLSEQSWSRFETVMAAKIDGAWNLHKLTLDTPLDFFLLFSTGASLLGSPGQSNYAAANAFLDGLAHYRHGQGASALSINWGAWSEVGMAARTKDQNQRRWTNEGIHLITPGEGAQVLESLLSQSQAQAAVLPINWSKFHSQESGKEIRPILRQLVKHPPAESPSPRQSQIAFLEKLKDTPSEEQWQFILHFVQGEVIKVLGLNQSETPNIRQGLTDIGMDSLMAVELSNRLQRAVGRSLPSTLIFEYPTIEALTNYLAMDILSLASAMDSKEHSVDVDNKQAIINEVESIPEDKLEEELLKELRDAGYES